MDGHIKNGVLLVTAVTFFNILARQFILVFMDSMLTLDQSSSKLELYEISYCALSSVIYRLK